MNTIDIVDYIPTLEKTPGALAVYSTLKHFCNKKGQCDVNLADVCSHLSLSPETMKGACKVLFDLKLLTKTDTGFIITMSPARLNLSTALSRYAFGNTVPNGYEVLLDQKQMYNCFTTNGLALWKVLAEVAHFFNLDYLVVKRLMDNSYFKTKFLAVREQVEGAAEVAGVKVTKRQLKKKSDKTITELYDQLINEVHIKNEHEIPIHEWNSVQLLRWYCLQYTKRYNDHYLFTTNPFGSREQIAMKKIHDAFDKDATVASTFVTWVLENKSNDANIKFPINPAFCANDGVIREYKQRGAAIQKHIKAPVIKVERKAPLPTSFLEWIIANVPKVQNVYHLGKMEDLQWIKKAYDEKALPDTELEAVILHAIEVGLLPKEGEVQFA